MSIRQLDILLYPPAINILLLLLAMLLWKHRRTALTLLSIATITLMAFSLQITSHQMALRLEKYPALKPDELSRVKADAIVVLGGGLVPHAREYNGSSLADDALMRLRYAAYLYTRTGLPVLASGAGYTAISEAETMKNILREDFGVHDVKTETTSRTTYENAVNSAKILKGLGQQRILLVTSSLHMNRSVLLFEQQGMEVIPAPTDLYSDATVDWRYYLPTGDALESTRYILHEYLALLWYRLKY
jgi:uncharacterized SAM-binding protein YcdF (DUF218 family)